MQPRYPLPWRLALEVLWSVARQKKRSFGQDATRALALLRFPIRVEGRENIPSGGPAVVVTNHYSRPAFGRPGFGAWWIALAISAQVPVEMHWSMTAAWTGESHLTSWVLSEISRRLFPRIAEVYSFTAMPPMPPRPFEQADRAQAVRQMLAAAKAQPPPVFGISPEGQDNPGGVLMRLSQVWGVSFTTWHAWAIPFTRQGCTKRRGRYALALALRSTWECSPVLLKMSSIDAPARW